MKFGKLLEKQISLNPAWEHQYVDYKGLKKWIQANVQDDSCSAARPPQLHTLALEKTDVQRAFIGQLESERKKLCRFVDTLVAELEERLRALLQKLSGSQMVQSKVQNLRDQAQAISNSLVDLDTFIYYNFEALRKISKKFDKKGNRNGSVSFTFMQVVEQASFAQHALNRFVVALSDVYSLIRTKEKEGLLEGGTWVPPESFERATTKYLVHADDVMKVKILIAEHLPTLIIGREEPGSKTTNVPDFLQVEDGSMISSVYFDDDAMSCYHERIKRMEGARLFRLRWYGSFEDPDLSKDIYVERKTHHESWVMENSVKERFSLSCKDVPAFMSGELKPDLSPKMQELANEIQQEITSRNLQPAVRTVYRRTAFQLASTNDVRISLDTQLAFIDEQQGERISGGWCRHVPTVGLTSEDFVGFDWAVLEVKLMKGKPEWVDKLIESGLCHEMQKFSKFGHGCAVFHSESGILKEMPYWYEGLKDQRHSSHEKHAHGDSSAVSSDVDLIFPQGHPVEDMVVPEQRPGEGSSKSGPDQLKVSKMSTNDVNSAQNSKKPEAVRVTSPVEKPEKAGRSGLSLRQRFSQLTNMGNDRKMPRRPAKVEPKTFFANERTFIQWLSPVMITVTLALGLQSVGSIYGSVTMTSLGLAFVGVAIMWLAYALHVYFKRMRKIQRQDPMGYHEQTGPVFLVIFLAAVCVAGSFTLFSTHFEAKSEVSFTQMPKHCGQVIADVESFPSLSAEPRDVLHHLQRKSLFVPSSYKLFELHENEGIIRQVIPFDGLDIQAVTMDPSIPDILWLGVENSLGRKGSSLMSYNLSSQTVGTTVDMSNIMTIEALAPCPAAICGPNLAGTTFLVGGHSSKIKMVQLSDSSKSGKRPVATVVDHINVGQLLCRLRSRCGKTGEVRKISGLHVTDDAIYAISDKEKELYVLMKGGRSQGVGQIDIFPLPPAEGWEGISVRHRPGSEQKTVILASDDMGLVAAFNLTAHGFDHSC